MRQMVAMLALCAVATGVRGAETTTVGFDDGDNMGFSGNALFEATDGNPGGAARHVGDLFFNDLRTGGTGEPENPGFLGSYSAALSVTFSVDVRTNLLTDFIGNPIVRSIGISLEDRDIMGPSGPSGVFFEMGLVGESINPDWTTYSVTIDDPTSDALPAGWIGFGDEDPATFEPVLPDGATFATVLASVDEFRVTGAVPGFFYTNAFWDVQIDNITVTVEEAGTPTRSVSWSVIKDGFAE